MQEILARAYNLSVGPSTQRELYMDKSLWCILVRELIDLLEPHDLANLYKADAEIGKLIIESRDWKYLYERTFTRDQVRLESGNFFERYIRRSMASVHVWDASRKPYAVELPSHVVVKDIVASRFLVVVLSTQGQLWVFQGNRWLLALSGTVRIWSGFDEIYAVDCNCKLYVWRYLDAHPMEILHSISSLDKASICAGGAAFHAVYIEKRLIWWRRTSDCSIVSTVFEEEEVQDMLSMKTGLVVLSKTGLTYWHNMAEPRRIEISGQKFIKLRCYDYHRGHFTVISEDGQMYKVQVEPFKVLQKFSVENGVDLNNEYALTRSGKVLKLAMWVFFIYFWRFSKVDVPPSLKVVKASDMSAALVTGAF